MSPSGEERPPGPLFSGRHRAERRALREKVGAPYLVPIALVAVAALLLWRYRAELAGLNLPVAAAGPETQVKEALAHQPRAALADVYGFHAGGTADLQQVRFADVTASVDQGRAKVLAVVEAKGTVAWRAERASLTYVGREAFGMTPCTIALWCGDGEQFARLRGVLTALFRRADAAGERDAQAAARLVSDAYQGPGGRAALLERLGRELRDAPAGAHIRAWQIRVERDRAQVGEDYDVAVGGGLERRRALYVLAREGERWLFVDGL